MSQVVSGVLEKLKDMLPNQIGTNRRWSDASVERHIMFADRLVRERVGNLYHQQIITLRAYDEDVASVYDLDDEFIDIISVEYASDGSTYDWYLKPATLDDLDKLSLSWRGGPRLRPERYTLLGTPGAHTTTLQVYGEPTTVGVDTLKVTGLGTGATTSDCADDIQGKCHVPHVMSVLLAKQNPNEAASWFTKYLDGCETVRRRTISKYSQGTNQVGVGW